MDSNNFKIVKKNLGLKKAAGNIIENILGELLVEDKDEKNKEPYPYQYPYQNPYQAPYGDSDIDTIDRQDDVDEEGVSLVSIIIAGFVGAIVGQLAVTFYGDTLFQNVAVQYQWWNRIVSGLDTPIQPERLL